MSRRTPGETKGRPQASQATARTGRRREAGDSARVSDRSSTLREPAAPVVPLPPGDTRYTAPPCAGLSVPERRELTERILREEAEARLPGIDEVVASLDAQEASAEDAPEDWPSELHPMHSASHTD